MPLRDTAMSMMTRCPVCGTAFRVSEQQLGAHEGQVRCGRCDNLFDAIATLSADPATRPSRDKPSPPPTSGSLAVLLGTEKDSSFEFGPRAPRPASRVWWIGSLLLLLALLAQGGYRYRGEIAVLVPETKPLLERMCAEFDCDVPLPRRAELLSIESSDLQADGSHPNVMVLTATLRNRAAFVQAYPALELSLTSAEGQTVARRVLLPKDYVVQPALPEAGFAAGSELQIRVYIEAAALKPTGYRLYLFYA
ncbi:MAG TPA: DUF3426 domain-containing protein [Burkholderiales bacterium]|nr:DUF3426 domain-containing protein [Burkholderiales bacterium]